jgi:acyl transferase domain-containing protein/acyl carrier protein
MKTQDPNRNHAIALIGMSGRFPNAENVEAFWRNLEHGVESLVEFSEAEMLEAGVPPVFFANPNFVKWGTPFEKADWFDAGFFGFNPREAEILDPQHRLFLECAWEALEDAGYGGDTRPESVGVYAGTSNNTYVINNVLTNMEVMEAAGIYQIMLASDKDFLATRVAYKLNLKGPCMAIQTACSTSLVAVQMACQALLAKQCDMALAGGVSLGFPEKSGYLYSEGMILSPDGRCRPFDAEGRGIRGGHGAGIVVLKRLDEALRDRDSIRAVILGAAVNNDGADKMGYSAPSVEGQSSVISAAIRMSGMNPESISFVEAHGTGTQVGDPIEIAGLERAFRAHTDKKQFCAIGAVKGNIGHLDAAAGVAGLIKTTLALEHKKIPATLNFNKPNLAIDFANGPFYVNDKLSDWESNGSPRRAGVSSFGIGGTNAHVVLEEAPEAGPSKVLWPSQLLLLSARSSIALDAMTDRMAKHFEADPAISLADACYTAQIGRKRFAHRRMLFCLNRDEAIEGLKGGGSRKSISAVEESDTRSVVFMFSGQGSQHPGMARGLYEMQPVFRNNIDFCAEFLAKDLGCDLRTVLFSQNADSQILNETRIAQPALFAVEYALAQMWMSWGVLPDAMIGHSIGEYVAACIAGVFSLEDALRIVAARGRIMQQMPAGSMLAVSLPLAEARNYLDDQISLAAVNSPSLCTLSGPQTAMASLKTKLESSGVSCRALHTSHAFHSSMLDGALDPFSKCMKDVKLSPPNRRFLSNLTGTWIKSEQATDPLYWVKHLRQPVYFAEGIRELAATPGRIFLEVGPGQALSTFARDCTRGMAGSQVLSSLPHPKDSQPDTSFVVNAVGKLWLAGVAINWEKFHKGETLHRVSLPSYFFERKRYCVKRITQGATPASTPDSTAKVVARREELSDWFYIPSWQRSVSPAVIAPSENYGPWLIFAEQAGQTGLGDEVCKVLAARGERFTIVRQGQMFAGNENGELTIRPGRAEDYGRLLNELQSRGFAPRSILHLWSLPGGMHGETQSGRTAFDSLVFLAQAFGDSRLQASIDWVVVTSGLHAVTGLENLDPLQALVLGPMKVIPREYSNITCRAIDVFPVLESQAGQRGAQQELIENILLEPGMPRAWRPVAYRDSYRWEQTFEPVRLPARTKTAIHEKGLYLITGGMGGIGLTFAAYLAEQGHARLALISRSAIPERSEWQRWIKEHDEDDATSRKIRSVEKLESLGAEVLPLTANVSDREEMLRALDAIHARFGPINGVIHAAGIPGGGLVQLKNPGATENVLSPKVAGTLVLESLLNVASLDFFVLCSSVDAISPLMGAVDYCAANAFLDAYAAAQNAKGNRGVVSINWDTWQEVGMAENVQVPRELKEQRRAFLASAIRPTEGVESFRRVLAARLPQVAVITRDLPRLITEVANWSNSASDIPGFDESMPQQVGESGHSRPDLPNAFIAPETDIQKRLAEIWMELLGIEQIGIDDNFFEMGGHSLLATGVLSRIRNAFGVSIPLRTIFETPTIRQLSSHLETLLWVVSGKSSAIDASEEREEIEI